MRTTDRFFTALVAVGFAGVGFPVKALADGKFMKFPETISPDGSYCLAWGVPDKPEDDLGTMVEVPLGGELDFEAEVSDFLVDVKKGKVIVTIPGLDHFATGTVRKNRSSLTVAWSPDSRFAIAIQEGRYSTADVAWIDTRQRKAVSIKDSLDTILRGLVRQKHGKKEESRRPYVEFDQPVFLGPGVLSLDCELSGFISKFDEDIGSFNYRVKLNGSGTTESSKLRLISSRELSDKEAQAQSIQDDQAEAELNKAYGALRSKLSAAAKETLKAEELAWLKQREELPNDDKKVEFTKRRVVELRGRAEGL